MRPPSSTCSPTRSGASRCGRCSRDGWPGGSWSPSRAPGAAASLGLKLLRDDRQLDRAPVTVHAGPQAAADPLGFHQPLEVADVAERDPVALDDQVLGTEPGPRGGAAVDNLDHLDA